MDNEKKMVEQIEKIIANNDEVEIAKSVNIKKKEVISYAKKGSIENIFLGILITATVLGGIVVGIMLAK